MTHDCERSKLFAGMPLLLLLIASASTCTGQSAVQEPRLASMNEIESYVGCYDLGMGRWWPWSFGEDAKYVTPPNRIELTRDRGTEGWAKGHLLIRFASAQKAGVSGGRGASFWDVHSNGRIALTWTDGFTGVTLKLERNRDDLGGWAYPHLDAGLLIPRIAHVKGSPNQL